MTAHNITAAELEKLLAEVTPGEWEAFPGHEQQNGQRYWQIQNEYDAIMQNQFCWAQGSHESNARLIAMAPTLARKVIAAEKLVEALTAEIAGLTAALDAERTGADDLAIALEAVKDNSRRAYNLTENFPAVLSAVSKAADPALSGHAARRKGEAAQ